MLGFVLGGLLDSCVCVYVCLCVAMCVMVQHSLISCMGRELRALQRSRCLDSGSALMGLSQITVITLAVVIRGSSLGGQKASLSFTRLNSSMAHT